MSNSDDLVAILEAHIRYLNKRIEKLMKELEVARDTFQLSSPMRDRIDKVLKEDEEYGN